MTEAREFINSPVPQGEDETVYYRLTITPWGGTPVSVAVKLYDVTKGARTDVSSTKLSGAATVNGDMITTPGVTGLVEGHVYRLEIKFISSGNTLEAFGSIVAER